MNALVSGLLSKFMLEIIHFDLAGRVSSLVMLTKSPILALIPSESS